MDSQSRAEKAPPYQIIESDGFGKQFAALVPDAKIRDEILRGFYVELPINPDQFVTVPGTKLKAAKVLTSPPLTLFFYVKNRIITLIEIHPFA